MRIHLCHIVPDARHHGLLGYSEVIDTVRWGLTELGHEVTVRVNSIADEAINIAFGAQMLSAEQIDALPDSTIVYFLEQSAQIKPEHLRPACVAAARRLQIWDYSPANVATWNQLAPAKPPLVVPIGWAPILQRISKSTVQDIDVLHYGGPTNQRLHALAELCHDGVKVVWLCGLYGQARDDLIARSRIVLNINSGNGVFEIVRVSYLLANAKAVVSDLPGDCEIDDDLRDVIAFAPLDGIRATCSRLLGDDSERRRLETAGAEAIARRDIRGILREALQSSGHHV
ncbi:MAG: hypothetical protein ACREJC_22595 [Tepidisphaeraceae bacterium]